MNETRVRLLKEYIKEEPDNPFNKYALAMEYYNANPDESLVLLRKLLSDHPTYLATYFKAAHLLWEAEVWDESDKVFQKGIALAKEQNDTKALLELESAYLNFEFDKED